MDIAGRWTIVSLNGVAPRGGGTDADGRRAPWLVFTAHSYGGNTGCNSFGGLDVLVGDRFYGAPPMQTAIGCGDLMAQESAITGLLASGPRVAANGDGTLTIGHEGRTMVLRRDTSAAAPSPSAAAPPPLLAGTRWHIHAVDGQWYGRDPGSSRTLIFEADRWSFRSPCGERMGAWRQSGDRVQASADAAPPASCAPAEAAIEARVAAMMAAPTRFATGPNGEILIGGGGHWVVGEQPREPLTDQASLLAGSWRIVGIDGAPPVAGSEPGIAFGPGGYSGGTGCNSFQGLFLAHRRRLFTGWGLQTEIGCAPPLGAQEERITGLLASAPRIALTAGGEIALVDHRGRLQLQRRSSTAPAVPQASLWRGEPLQAELTMLDGEPLRMRVSQPETRLRLTAQRFDIYSGCARLGGIWRGRGDELEFLTDPEAPPEGVCGGPLVERLPAFMRLGNGRFRALIGRSRELLIAGEHHWLAGQIAAPSRKPR